MSRFGNTATFYYQSGDGPLTAGTYLYLTADSMPQYPFEDFVDTDRQALVAKSGRKYLYQNYAVQGYKFNFSNLSETTRGSLKTMWESKPLFTFNTNSQTWGTFRFGEDPWQDQEISYELYDLNFTIVEDA